MAKIINENKGFESISRNLIFDSSLSDRARFVYCYMSAKPDGWDFTLAPMAAELGYSVDTLRKYIKELIESGWIVRGEQRRDGANQFGSVEYIIKCEPYRKKTDTGKTRHGKNPTQEINNNIRDLEDSSTINSPTKEEIRLSDDKHNIVSDQYDEQFSDFWKQYGKSVDKQGTYKVWCRLSKKDKERAIAMIQPYKENRCHYDKKFMLDPIRYLRRKTWEDDLTPAGRVFYDVQDGDSERVVAFKNWMRSTFPYIEQAVSPLSYDEYMNLIQKYSVDEVGEQLHYINENMVRYKRSTISEEIDFFLKRHREEGAA